jgi:AraC-like DNA-binding protein
MQGNNEFTTSPTPEFETWRVRGQSANGSLCQYVQYDAITSAMEHTKLCGLPVVDLVTHPVSSAERIRADAVRDGMDDFKLLIQISGRSILDQNERVTDIGAGDLGIVDITRPVHVAIGGAGRVIGLHLPRQPLVAHLGFEPQGGLCWKGENVLPARLLTRLVSDAIADGDVGPDSSQDFVRSAIFNLVGALFGAAEVPQHFSQADKLFLRLCHIIKHNFSDPDLGPADIAAEARVSVRYLQKIFALRGTTYSIFLKSLRLDHAASLLDRRAEADAQQPLAEIAWACGYRDYAHFARDFRFRFQHAPGSFSGRLRDIDPMTS